MMNPTYSLLESRLKNIIYASRNAGRQLLTIFTNDKETSRFEISNNNFLMIAVDVLMW